MNISFDLDINSLAGTLSLILIALYISWLYRNRDSLGPQRPGGILIPLLRLLSLLLILMTLLDVKVFLERKLTENTALLFLWDNSASMNNSGERADYESLIVGSEWFNYLKDKTKVKHLYGYDENIRESGSAFPELDFSGSYTDLSAMISAAEALSEEEGSDMILVSDGQSHFGRDPVSVRSSRRIYTVGVGSESRSVYPAVESLHLSEPCLEGDPVKVAVTLRNSGAAAVHGVLRWTLSDEVKIAPVDIDAEFRKYADLTLPRLDAGTHRGTIEFLTDSDTVLLRDFRLKVRKRAISAWFDSTVYDPDYKMVHTFMKGHPDVDITVRRRDDADLLVLYNAEPSGTDGGTDSGFRLIFTAAAGEGAEISGVETQSMTDLNLIDADPDLSGRAWAELPPVFWNGRRIGGAQTVAAAKDHPEQALIQYDPENASLYFNGRGFWKWRFAGYREVLPDVYTGLLENFLAAVRRGRGTGLIRFVADPVSGVKNSDTVFPYALDPGFDLNGENWKLVFILQDTEGRTLRRLEKEGAALKDGSFSLRPEKSGVFKAFLLLEQEAGLLSSDSTEVLVSDMDAELLYTGRNSPALRQLAENNGGRMFTIDSLTAENASVVVRPCERMLRYSVIARRDLPLLLILFTAASLEWWLRKRKGQL